MEKILSIVIPMFNSYKFIDKCLASLVVNENILKKIQVIVINDGSTDKCEEKVLPYTINFPDTFFLINKSNGGHGSVVNMSIKYMQGKYFKVLDADDWMKTVELELLICELENINVDCAIMGYHTYDIRDSKEAELNLFIPSSKIININQLQNLWKYIKTGFCLHGLVYNLQFYKSLKLKVPENVYYDDAFFYTVPCSYVKTIYLSKAKPYVYRIGDIEQSVSNLNRTKRIDQLETVIKKIVEAENDIDNNSHSGLDYFIKKASSTICDYYVTVFLRFKNRNEGLKKAKTMQIYVRNNSIHLHNYLKIRYIILRIMFFFKLNDDTFDKLISIKSYLYQNNKKNNKR